MKYFVLIFSFLTGLLIYETSMAYTHKVTLADVGVIESKGKTQAEAFKNTANTCIDRRIQLFRQVKGHEPSDDRILEFADHCVNVSWNSEG